MLKTMISSISKNLAGCLALRLASALVALSLTAVPALPAAPALPADPDARVKNLGEPITEVSVNNAASLGGRLYTVTSGYPAKLVEIDGQTSAVTGTWPLSKTATGGWTVAASTDGFIYVGTYFDARVYRFDPAKRAVEDLGQPIKGESTLCVLKAGDNGVMYGGTFPNCRLFEYSPAKGFRTLSDGPIVPGEAYVRRLAYDPATKKLYAGIGSHAHLMEIDTKTGAITDITPKGMEKETWVFFLSLEGGKLFANFQPSNETLCIDPATKKVEGSIKGLKMPAAGVSPYDAKTGSVFYADEGSNIHQYFLKSATSKPFGAKLNFSPIAWAPFKDGLIYIFGRLGEVGILDPASAANTKRIKVDTPTSPLQINALSSTPDGKIMTSGILPGGLNLYDPDKGMALTKSLSFTQCDAMAPGDKFMYLGTYPSSNIWRLDPAKPLNLKDKNPDKLFDLEKEHQERVTALLPIEAKNKLYVGTVSAYGKPGGLLSSYDLKTGEVKTHPSAAPEQSVVSLALVGDRIFGGTSVVGGLGSQPTTKEGKLFVWNTVTDTLEKSLVPMPGETSVDAVVLASDGNVWGFNGNTLFCLDPKELKVTFTTKVNQEKHSALIAREAGLVDGGKGVLYMTNAFKHVLYAFDLKTRVASKVYGGGYLGLAKDAKGRIYFSNLGTLHSYEP